MLRDYDKAAAAWDPDRYYTDPRYYNNPKLVRPYRVGMSCGFCHVGPNPLRSPADPENPFARSAEIATASAALADAWSRGAASIDEMIMQRPEKAAPCS